MSPRRFAFLFDPRFAGALRGLGVRADTAEVTVDAATVTVRYGPWILRTPLANVAAATVTGPYRWWRAIGPRLSLADRGVTFGTAPHAGACLQLHEPVPALLGRFVPHPGVTVTVADPAGLATEIARRKAA